MILKIFALLIWLTMSNEKTIFDFTNTEELSQWRKVNDVVMGGVSKSNFEITEESIARFSGILSPDNNGGFASYRAVIKENLAEDFEGIAIKFRGDSNLYNIRFRTDESFDGYSYQAKFKTEIDKWQEVKIPFKDFIPTYRGRILQNKPQLESKNISQVGILIADKQFGEFSIDIDWIKIY